MSDGSGGGLQVVYNLDRILDCHTHLTGMEGESAGSILGCMDFCGIEKVFLFAPMLDVRRHEITSDSLADIRAHKRLLRRRLQRLSGEAAGFLRPQPAPRPRRRRPRRGGGPDGRGGPPLLRRAGP